METKHNVYEMFKKINREESILKMDIHCEQECDNNFTVMNISI